MASANEGKKKIMPRERWPTTPKWGLRGADFSAWPEAGATINLEAAAS
jgi:hypothetical protein